MALQLPVSSNRLGVAGVVGFFKRLILVLLFLLYCVQFLFIAFTLHVFIFGKSTICFYRSHQKLGGILHTRVLPLHAYTKSFCVHML